MADHNHVFPPSAGSYDVPMCLICDFPYRREEDGRLYLTIPVDGGHRVSQMGVVQV